LIRDSCKVVQRAVLQSPKLSDREVESYAAMASLNDEVLRGIATKRSFRKNYAVIRNLVNNSKTPLDVSLNLLKSIQTLDLKMLLKNKNIPETLRTTATKMFKQRQQTRGGGGGG
jgi:ribosomal protein L28